MEGFVVGPLIIRLIGGHDVLLGIAHELIFGSKMEEGTSPV